MNNNKEEYKFSPKLIFYIMPLKSYVFIPSVDLFSIFIKCWIYILPKCRRIEPVNRPN